MDEERYEREKSIYKNFCEQKYIGGVDENR